MAAANRWIAECYLPAQNEASAVMPDRIAFVRNRTASEVVYLQEEPRSVTKTMARTHSAHPAQSAVPHSCAPRCGAGTTRTPAGDLFRVPIALPIMTATEICAMIANRGSRGSLRQPLVDLWTTHRVANNPHARPRQKRSIDALRKAVTLTRQRQSGLVGHLNSQAFAPLLGTPLPSARRTLSIRKGLIKIRHHWDLAQIGESRKAFFIMLLCSWAIGAGLCSAEPEPIGAGANRTRIKTVRSRSTPPRTRAGAAAIPSGLRNRKVPYLGRYES